MLLLAATLRFRAIGAASYWIDELFALQESNGNAIGELYRGASLLQEPVPQLTALEAARPWPRIVAALYADNHPPLYFWLLRFWREHVADGETATRALSAVFSLLALALTWASLRARCGARAALLCGLLLALSAQQIRYAQEVRAYCLVMACVALAVFATERLASGGSRWPWASLLGAAALAAMLSHYYAAGALAGLGLWAAVNLKAGVRRAAFASLASAALIFIATWGPVMARQRRHVMENNAWSRANEPGHLRLTALRVAAWPVTLLGDERALDAPRTAVLGVLGWLAFALAGRRREIRLFAWTALGSLLLLVGVDLASPAVQLEVPRYSLVAAPAFAAVLASTGGRRGWLVPVTVAVAIALRMPHANPVPRPPWREFARIVDRIARPHEPVIVLGPSEGNMDSAWTFQALRHYAWSAERPFALVRSPARLALRVALARAGTAVVVRYDEDANHRFLPPFQVGEELTYSSDTPRILRVSFASPVAP